MAQTWPASVTTEPGVAGGAAAALLLVSYASELNPTSYMCDMVKANNFFKKKCYLSFFWMYIFVSFI